MQKLRSMLICALAYLTVVASQTISSCHDVMSFYHNSSCCTASGAKSVSKYAPVPDGTQVNNYIQYMAGYFPAMGGLRYPFPFERPSSFEADIAAAMATGSTPMCAKAVVHSTTYAAFALLSPSLGNHSPVGDVSNLAEQMNVTFTWNGSSNVVKMKQMVFGFANGLDTLLDFQENDVTILSVYDDPTTGDKYMVGIIYALSQVPFIPGVMGVGNWIITIVRKPNGYIGYTYGFDALESLSDAGFQAAVPGLWQLYASTHAMAGLSINGQLVTSLLQGRLDAEEITEDDILDSTYTTLTQMALNSAKPRGMGLFTPGWWRTGQCS